MSDKRLFAKKPQFSANIMAEHKMNQKTVVFEHRRQPKDRTPISCSLVMTTAIELAKKSDGTVDLELIDHACEIALKKLLEIEKALNEQDAKAFLPEQL